MRKVTLLLIALSVFGLAQNPVPVLSGPDPAAPARVGVGITQRKLTLEEAVQMGLKNNLEIEIEKTNRSTAQEAVQAARGFFDPTFRWAPLFQVNNTPTGSVLQGAGGKLTDRFLAQNFYLRQQLPSNGALLHLDFENSRQTTTNPFTSFSPLLSSRLAVGFTQPLLRGRETDRNRAELKIRQKRVSAANVDFEARVIDVVGRVEQSYWDLVAIRQEIAVRGESVALAREQLAINQRMVNAGTLAPVELAAARAELERRTDSWYSAIGVLTEVENTLKTLLAPDRNASIWSDEILPAEERSADQPPADDLREAVAAALKRRPELRNVGIRQQINDVEKDINANLRKPEVNFVAQYSLNGLGGSLSNVENPFTSSNTALYQRLNQLSIANGLAPIPPPSFGSTPDFLVGNYGTAVSNLFGGRYQSFQVGLAIDVNLRNRTADATYAQSMIAERRLKLEQERTAQAIEAQVRNALQGIQTSKQRIAAADASAMAAREKLESETRLYQTGESTNFLVLTRQNEYADSRRRAVAARLELNKSIARLEQAMGRTLSVYKITLQ